MMTHFGSVCRAFAWCLIIAALLPSIEGIRVAKLKWVPR